MNMTPDLFLDCIILLIHNNDSKNKKIVAELIELYTKDFRGKSSAVERDTLINFYIRVLRGLLDDKFDPSNKDECRLYLLKLRSDSALEKRRDLYDLLSEAFLERDELSSDRLDEIVRGIQNQLVASRINRALRSAFGHMGNAKDAVSVEVQSSLLRGVIDELRDAADQCENNAADEDHSAGLVDRVSFSDPESMKAATIKHEQRTVTGGIKLGLKGLNRMFGKEQRVALGESVVFNALSHHYKSGILQSIAAWSALYNIPPAQDGLKPLILFISLENEAFQNFIWMTRKFYTHFTGEDAATLTQDELVGWAHKKFSDNGVTLEILRYLPDQFGYEEVVMLCAHYRRLGYYVYAVIIDYMNSMRKGADSKASGSANHLAVKELYSKTCNYLKTIGATLFTAHQLNREAAKIANSGITDVVKRLTPEHLSDSMDVQREVDTSVFMYIEKNHEGFPFLTFRRDKRRYDDKTPETHKHCAYPFRENGIVDDIDDNLPGFVPNIYMWSFENLTDPADASLVARFKEMRDGTSVSNAAAADIF